MPSPVIRPRRRTAGDSQIPVVRSTPAGKAATLEGGIVQPFDAPPLAQQQSRVMPTHPHQHLGAAAPYHGLHPTPLERMR